MKKISDMGTADVYNLVDRKVGEVSATVSRLESKFDNLIDKRVIAIEKDIANINGRLMFIPLLITIAVNAFFFLTNYILNK